MIVPGLKTNWPLLGALPYAHVAPPTSTSTSLSWGPCPPEYNAPSEVQCASLAVPLDYSDPMGMNITLTMLRVKSKAARSKGSVHLNPGGPGGSGTAFVLAFSGSSNEIGNMLLEEYDLIGLDPRGIGLSSPIKCDPVLWNQRIPTMIRNEKEYDTLVEHWKNVGESCREMTGPLLDHLDTLHVAKDFESVRRALGDEKLNFIGLSYGTQIGYTYAEMFPESVGRMILDGVLDHSQMAPSFVQTESTTYETTLHKFFTWCNETSTCVLHDHDIKSLFQDLVTQAEKQPLPAPNCTEEGPLACHPNVTLEDFLYGAGAQLIFQEDNESFGGNGWLSFAENLLAASKGDATSFSSPIYTESHDPSGMWAGIAVGCQDFGYERCSYEDLQALIYQTNTLSPLTRGFAQSYGDVSRCVGWPASLTNPPRRIKPSIEKAPPILMVNSFWDPSTSVQWAVQTKGQIPHSHLVFRNGSGHTSLLTGGETGQALVSFMLEGSMPVDGTVYQS